MGERGVRNAEVEGSNPLPSTIHTTRRHALPEVMMAEQLPRGLYTLLSLAMIAVLVCDFIWVASTALHAMH